MRLLSSSGGSSSGGLQPLMIPALGLALLALLAAAIPARALPRQVDALLYDRRESLVFTVIGVLLAFLIALLIAHVGS